MSRGHLCAALGAAMALASACTSGTGSDGASCPDCIGDGPSSVDPQAPIGPTQPGTAAGPGTSSQAPTGTSAGATDPNAVPGTGTPSDASATPLPPAPLPTEPPIAGTGAEPPMPSGGCGQTLPPVTDYGANGPFATTTVNATGPNGQYTMIRPSTLGENGFLHPVATWGNGITTTPANYPGLLNAIASHGFVIIASNSSNVTAALMTQGLDWLIAQNDAAGPLQGMLDTDCAVTIGYSLGGGASVGSGSHPAVVATVSWHGLQGPAENLHAPLFLITSTSDGFVTKSGYVQPCYDRSTKVPTIMATLEVPGAPADFFGHLLPLGDAGQERAPGIAWLRMWVYGDTGAEAWFYGGDCTLCGSPWTDIQRKNATW